MVLCNDRHTVFLLSVSADSPARQKMAMWPAVAAYLACGWCLFEGFRRDGDQATHFKGYAEPAQQSILSIAPCKVGDHRVQVPDCAQHGRAQAVEEGRVPAWTAGCKGYSEFARYLTYVSYNDLWELPIYHAGLYGVVKGFVGFLLSDFTGECPLHIIPKKNRAIMRERGKKLRLTAEFGRPYRCIVDSYKSFQLVDWLHFLETFSLFVLRTDVLDEVMQKMWDRLRSGLLHYFRIVAVDDNLSAPGSTFSTAERNQAHDDLFEYASMVEQNLPDSLLTYNLHILVCRLKRQEDARGCVATCGELWVERGIQQAKSNVKYRTTRCPELLYVHDFLVDEALAAMRHSDATNACKRTSVKTFDELVPRYRANVRAGPLYDMGDDTTGTQLIGKGKKLKPSALNNALQNVSQYLQRMGQGCWTDVSGLTQQPPDSEVCSYTLAHKRGDELMWSVAHRRSRSRVSFYAKLRFISRHGTESLYIAEVTHFLRAVNEAADVLRLAVCKLYPAGYGLAGMRATEDIMTATLGRQDPDVLAVDISELDTKLVTAKEGNKLYGLVYNNTSGMA